MELTTANIYATTFGKIVFWDLEATQVRDYNYAVGDLVGLSYLEKQTNSKGDNMYKVSIGGKAVIRTDANGRTNTELTTGRYDAWINEKYAVLEKTTRDVSRGDRGDSEKKYNSVGGGDNNSGLFLLAGVAAIGLFLKFFPVKKKKKK